MSRYCPLVYRETKKKETEYRLEILAESLIPEIIQGKLLQKYEEGWRALSMDWVRDDRWYKDYLKSKKVIFYTRPPRPWILTMVRAESMCGEYVVIRLESCKK